MCLETSSNSSPKAYQRSWAGVHRLGVPQNGVITAPFRASVPVCDPKGKVRKESAHGIILFVHECMHTVMPATGSKDNGSLE